MNTPNDSALDDQTAIDVLYERWRAALARKNVEDVLELLTPDYIVWASGAPPLGREVLGPRLRGRFCSVRHHFDIRV